MDTLEGLRRKLAGAEDLKTVVRTMKAISAANINQYELAVNALEDYYKTVALGFLVHFDKRKEILSDKKEEPDTENKKLICAIVFGSDQGLVGQFNDSLTSFVSHSLQNLSGKKEIWAVGERVQLLLSDIGLNVAKLFTVPNSVNAITPLVGDILVQSQENIEAGILNEFYIFYNKPKDPDGYKPIMRQLLSLDKRWKRSFDKFQWPTNKIPQIAGEAQPTLKSLIREYLFVSLFNAIAASLVSENSSRLSAMERANKNIEELLHALKLKYHQERQKSINEELFDVIAGFEALKSDEISNKNII
ncbi:MAG: F0F1 ATP synthase subunit gamma [Lutibacter sp.]|nr:F0F1 ATP synthase subunit gamma [Lutibacter sp.]MDT8417767.1 F0F1 ATP synthase subunit gamma [Lutibacter sp.]